MIRPAFWLAIAPFALACKSEGSPGVPPDTGGVTADSAAAADSLATEALVSDASDGATRTDGAAVVDTGENCPSALYPPRTDGCPCFPPVGKCSEEEKGRTCDYFQKCPPAGDRVRCEFVIPKEGPHEYRWIIGIAPCPDSGT